MPTQTRAQARQSQIDQLDSLGTSTEQYENADVFSAAEIDVANFITRVKENIAAANMVLSGKIEDIGLIITQDEIRVLGNDYLLYQDRGVQGSVSGAKAPKSPHKYTDKMPPLDIFIDYVRSKNLHLRNESDYAGDSSPFAAVEGDESEEVQLARAIQISVFKYGFKPRNIFAKEIPKLKEDLKISIKDFGKNAIREVFNLKRL